MSEAQKPTSLRKLSTDVMVERHIAESIIVMLVKAGVISVETIEQFAAGFTQMAEGAEEGHARELADAFSARWQELVHVAKTSSLT